MSVKTSLQKVPWLFDALMKMARKSGRQSPLYCAIAAHLPKGTSFTFLQVGANDGISCDPFREFMIRPEARGIAVEPVLEYYSRLTRNYRSRPQVKCLRTAVGYPARDNRFFSYAPAYLLQRGAAAFELSGLAGFSREKLERSLLPGDDATRCIQEIVVPTRTVEDLMDAEGFASFDCLFLDCEGHEENILTNLDYDRVRPRLIVFEHTHFSDSGQRLISHLAARGFVTEQLTNDTVASRSK